jgi:ATP-dependent RNA helicase DeaD
MQSPLATAAAVICCADSEPSFAAVFVTTKLFSKLGLSSELLKVIDMLGFEQAAPIQAEAIPLPLQGKEVVGQSQTGSGKTVAFAAPAVEKVMVEERVTQVLILCPTRELAVQVAQEVHKLALFKHGLHALPAYGGNAKVKVA